jgi:Flp pilus assembly pilin Flp
MLHDRRQVNRKELMYDRMWYVTLAVRNRFRCQSGQTLMEYAVLLAFIAIFVVVAVRLFGVALSAYWQNKILAKFPSG